MTAMVGTILARRYRLEEPIGTGGMSTVFRAFDTVLERRVAIKLMHPQSASDAGQLERFRREARAVAQLSHPHIVQVIDAGEAEEGPDDPLVMHGPRPFIVFEYVEGENLKQRIRRLGRLPVDAAIAYAIEIARALGAAHARHIVHRDVKPQNVLIDEEGSAKVTDFGIARTLEEEGLTAEGRVLGTTDYVSPEQALGHPVTGQSDLYSLGIVLFEMLTGDVPFHGESQVAVAMKHVREDVPDVQALRPEVSAALAAVLDRATAKGLGRRYPDAQSLIADLEDALAIEAARSGTATGEATAVLRTLPGPARRRVPLRLRVPVFVAVGLLTLTAALIGGLVVVGVDQAERGTGAGRAKPPPGLENVSLGGAAARDYDPQGDRREHRDETTFVLDRDPSTTWSTETYQGGAFPPGKAGVGLYVDARPGTRASKLDVQSPTAGWSAEVYAARTELPAALPHSGWRRVGAADFERRGRTRVDLDTGGARFRYFLLWITALPRDGRVRIAEVRLFRPRARAGASAAEPGRRRSARAPG